MPMYKKKFKAEWHFFINPTTGNLTYNTKCKACIYDCKQSYKAEIICCKEYEKATTIARKNKYINGGLRH